MMAAKNTVQTISDYETVKNVRVKRRNGEAPEEGGFVSFVSTPPGAGEKDWHDPAGWREPAELPDGLPSVQPFDPLLLPERMRPWVEDIAERMQVAARLPRAWRHGRLGSVVGRQIGIRPKRHDDWTVVPNLWGGDRRPARAAEDAGPAGGLPPAHAARDGGQGQARARAGGARGAASRSPSSRRSSARRRSPRT